MNLVPLFSAFFVIGLAELGDKTQLLTIALASKFPMEKVIYGVVCATAALTLIAVLLGEIITTIIPSIFISIFAGAFFIIYGLMMIRKIGDDEKEEKIVTGRNEFLTIFGSFFIAELGDKTQLATFAISAKYAAPFQVWIGATLGMVLVNLFGIVIGNIMRNYLPEKTSKFIGGIIFILFGLITFLSMMLRV